MSRCPITRRSRGRVFGTEYLGTTQIVTVDIEQGQIKARLSARLPVRLGETVGLAFRPEKLVALRCRRAARSRARFIEGSGHG